VVSIASATPVEAVEADIEAGRIVDRVEALGTIFSVDRLRCAWGAKLWRVNVRTGHFARKSKEKKKVQGQCMSKRPGADSFGGGLL
jgi:hypothetical protein